ncbi:MAG: hypothetical protein Q4G62_01760, partial [Pseudomonadota bacterium]|nr:hypothetical protein [Pseudomonadota bacterium]
MITLKTLSSASAQAAADQIVQHLLTQNERSILDFADPGLCAYRGMRGLKCAAGCLIADDEYDVGI